MSWINSSFWLILSLMTRFKRNKVTTSIIPRRYEFELDEDEVISVLKKHLSARGCKIPEGSGVLSIAYKSVVLMITEKTKKIKVSKEIADSEEDEDPLATSALFSIKTK